MIAFFLLRSVGLFGGNVTVPNVVGDTSSVAVQTLKNDNLAVGTIVFRTDAQPKGIVLSTNPRVRCVRVEELRRQPRRQ